MKYINNPLRIEEIYKQSSAETMNRIWLISHTIATKVAIENLKEIYWLRKSF